MARVDSAVARDFPADLAPGERPRKTMRAAGTDSLSPDDGLNGSEEGTSDGACFRGNPARRRAAAKPSRRWVMLEGKRRRVIAASATVVLSLGAARLLAQPDPVAGGVQGCMDTTCARICHLAGFPGGFCNSGGGCSCYL